MMARVATILAGALLVGFVPQALAQSAENHFASIFVDKNKIGQLHLTVTKTATGEVDELKTRASLTFLGAKLYSFTQHFHEDWADGELQTASGQTDDDGTAYEIALKRTPAEYQATLNGKPVTLPHDAFPTSLWHHRITEHTLLFNITDLRLLKVAVSKSAAEIKRNGRTVAAERYDFTGDWKGSVWFDADRSFLQATYAVRGREVTVVLD